MLGPFSIDTFFPAFGAMEKQFGVGPAAMQQTISVYMAAYSVMSLFHGPLSDAYGRRGVIMVSLLVYAGASAGCAVSATFHGLLLCRAVQGISAGAGMIVGRAIIRDRFEGPEAQRLMSQVTLIFGVAPALAPIVGGWVLYVAQWRWIFGLLAAFTILLLAAVLLALPETQPRERRTRFAPNELLRTTARICGDGPFMWLAGAASLNFSALFLYIASAPVIVLDMLRLNERQFGWLFIPTISGMMLGAALSGRLANQFSAARTVWAGYALIACGVAAHLLDALLLKPTIPWFLLPIGIDGMGISLAFPSLTLLMLDRFPGVRGAAASMQAALSLAASALIAGLISPAVARGALPLAVTSAAISGAGCICWLLYLRSAQAAEKAPTSPAHSG